MELGATIEAEMGDLGRGEDLEVAAAGGVGWWGLECQEGGWRRGVR